jgi:hypothetical protein
MLLTGSQFAKFMGTSRQNIYKLVRNGKLIKDDNNNYETDNPKNFNYIQLHGKSLSDISQYVMSISERKIKKPLKIKEPSKREVKIKPIKEIKSKPIKIEKVKVIPVKKEKPIIKTMVIENQEELENMDDELLDDTEILDDEAQYKKAYDITRLPRKLLNMNMKDLVLRHGNLKEIDNLSKILPRLFMAQEKETKDNERKNLLVPKEWTESKMFLYLEILGNRILDYPENAVDKIIAYTLSDKTTARLKSIELMRNDLSVFIEDTKSKITNEIERLIEKYQSESLND